MEEQIKQIVLKYFRKEGGHYYPQFNSDCEAWTDFVDELSEVKLRSSSHD